MAVLEGNGFLDRDLAGGSDFTVRGAGDLSSAASPLSAKISSAIGPESVTLGTGQRPLPRSVDASSSGVGGGCAGGGGIGAGGAGSPAFGVPLPVRGARLRTLCWWWSRWWPSGLTYWWISWWLCHSRRSSPRLRMLLVPHCFWSSLAAAPSPTFGPDVTG